MPRQQQLALGPMNRQQQIEQLFWEYHKNHPEIWMLFCRYTFAAIRRGFEHSSAKFIINLIRWESKGPDWTGPNEFKIGDIYPPYYARLFMSSYPEHAPTMDESGELKQGFFRLRKLRSEAWEPLNRPEIGPVEMASHEVAGLKDFHPKTEPDMEQDDG